MLLAITSSPRVVFLLRPDVLSFLLGLPVQDKSRCPCASKINAYFLITIEIHIFVLHYFIVTLGKHRNVWRRKQNPQEDCNTTIQR